MSTRANVPIQVRLALEIDTTFISALAAVAFAEFSQQPRATMLSMLENSVTLVAESGQHRLGFASLGFPKPQLAHLNAIAVRYRDRGTGVGAELLRAAERCARERRASRLELFTADSNTEALALFHKGGFELERRRDHYYVRGQTACLFAKSL